jgi:hypothetical protein
MFGYGGMMIGDSEATIRGLLDDARSTAARLRVDGPVSGSDAAGVVTVEVSPRGAVLGVRLDERWRARLADGDLGKAVVEALGSTQQAAATAWANGSRPAAAADSSAPPPADVPGRALRSRPEGAGFARELLSLLMQVETTLSSLPELAAEAATREVLVRGDSMAVTAVARQGVLVRVECDQHWLDAARTGQVERELTSVLTRALPGIGDQVIAELRGTGRIGELLDLAADPVALMGRLGVVVANPTARAEGAAHAA